ncbi:MAG TPA: nitronate monooxygenase [Rickettsiales bacterium]|nr:nitronate monooxygenase [Rickettsiales bacterium]
MFSKLGIELPIIQAPMAGVSTPVLAAAVSNAGGLGSLGVGAMDAACARRTIEETKALTDKPFNVNVFVHEAARADAQREAAWLKALAPYFQTYDAEPPKSIREIYKSFREDGDMLDMLLAARPAVVSFHFGLPSPAYIAALKNAGITLLATATNLDEAHAIQAAGIDAGVAQGIEAGGHRGVFDPKAHDDALSTFVLTRLLVERLDIPVIASGGIMDGAGIAAALRLGAVAAQLGTAFIACPESSANDAFRAALKGPGAQHTVMTDMISGRPARCLANRFTALSEALAGLPVPDYPIAYDAGKALNAAALAKGEGGFGAQWAGQGAPLARSMPAAELVRTLAREMAGLS